MTTTHAHTLEPWPFPEPVETEVITTRQVLEGAPVLLAKHFAPATWLFHCASTQSIDDKRTGCLGCIASAHPEVVELADLPLDHHANRNTQNDPWERFAPQKSVREIVQAGIDADGFQIVLLPPDRPIWAFTIGLQESFDQPEVMVIGVPGQMLHQMVINLAHFVAAGESISAGLRTSEVLQNLECELRPVDPVWYDVLLRPLKEFYGAKPFTVLQCLWPDKQGKFPFDEDFNEALRARQPYLEHADAKRASMTQLLAAMGKG
jgi:hypothetical protein